MSVAVDDADFTLYCGDVLDVLRTLPDESTHCCVTSPPYWGLRDYGADGQLGLEPTPEQYVANMVAVFREVRRVLRKDGTCWLNIGDSYCSQPNQRVQKPGGRNDTAGWKQDTNTGSLTQGSSYVPGLKPKDLIGVPWRLAFALQADGWYLRADIIWAKPNPMPESVTDRTTKAHEYVFLLTRSPRYFFDQEAVREPAEWARWGDQTYSPEAEAMYGQRLKPRRKSDIERLNGRNVQETNSEAERRDEVGGTFNNNPRLRGNVGRNIRSVWEIATQPYAEAHFATFPEALVERCVKAGSPIGGTILDPFIGSGTTALVARKHGRKTIGIELNPDYCALAARRLQQLSLLADAR